jgi:predicted secreted protein
VNSSIETVVGAKFDVTLEGNATTGYRWEFKPAAKSEAYVQFSGRIYEANAAKAGAPGLERFRFTAVKAGHVELLFWYRRSWEASPRKQVIVAVTIRPKP